MAEVIDHETERPSEEALADLLEAARENDADAQEELARHGLWPEEKEHEAEEAEADEEGLPRRSKLAWANLKLKDLEPLTGKEKSTAWKLLRCVSRRTPRAGQTLNSV